MFMGVSTVVCSGTVGESSVAGTTRTTRILAQEIIHQGLQLDDMHSGDHVLVVPATDDSPTVPEHTTVETPMNMSLENKAHYQSEKEAIHLILTVWKSTVNVAGARENVSSPVVQQSRIQCYNYKEFGHFAKEYKKPKRVKDSTYHKENMLLCKQAEKGVPLQAEQSDWLADMGKEIDEQKLDAHYSYMAKIHE
nr:hypothetical protein [Tanacetum cinerariifolium]